VGKKGGKQKLEFPLPGSPIIIKSEESETQEMSPKPIKPIKKLHWKTLWAMKQKEIAEQ
jgi:hypothetical protein